MGPGWPRTHYMSEGSLELLVLFPPPPDCWIITHLAPRQILLTRKPWPWVTRGTLCSCNWALGCGRSYYLGLLRVPLRSLGSSLEGFTSLLHLVNSCLAGLRGGAGVAGEGGSRHLAHSQHVFLSVAGSGPRLTTGRRRLYSYRLDTPKPSLKEGIGLLQTSPEKP